MSYIVAPNGPASGWPVVYLADIATTGSGTTLTATAGSAQTLYTTAYTLPAGKYVISVELQVSVTGGAVWGSTDWIVFTIQGATNPTGPSPQCTIPIFPVTSNTSIVNTSGVMTFATADTIQISCSAYGTATGKKVQISGFTYQRVA